RGRIDGLARARRQTRARPVCQPFELDGFGADQPRVRLRQGHRVNEQRGPVARLDEAPKIHWEVNRVAHQPGRKTDRERAQPLRASVVDAVPWRFIAVAGEGGITEEMELPASRG